MTILILVVFVTIFVSAQCSLYEATLYSTRMGSLEAAKSNPRLKRLAGKMIEMKQRISQPLAAILILNTIANTAGATIAGMYAHQVLGTSLVPLFSVLFTLGILLFAEIIPKTVGVTHWRGLWIFIVWPLDIMKYGLYPFILATEKLTSWLMKGHRAPGITEEDILGTVRLGARDGEISKWEGHMVHNIIRLEDMKVSEIMTPRTVMFALNGDMTVDEALKISGEKGFTRIPIYRGNREHIVGYVMIHDLSLAHTSREPGTTLAAIVKPIAFAPEITNCLTLLNDFLRKRLQIVVVTDEYGGVAGLVTLEDLLEVVLGAEIVDERDTVVDMQELARRTAQNRSDQDESANE
jgi:CBS domain containing-hemolysin-like protein